MNILVTGGAGFLGSHLVDELVLQCYNVLVFDDLSRGEKSQVNPKADFVEGDVRDSEKWEIICNAFNVKQACGHDPSTLPPDISNKD